MKGLTYKEFLETDYEPKEEDLICEFFIKAGNLEKAAGGVAAESSIGTWDPNLKTFKPEIRNLGARVFDINSKKGSKRGMVKIAYPQVLFEPGNIPQILSSIAGNVFGMKLLDNLRLIDITFPKELINSFRGPQLGISGIRDITEVKDRPLLGTIVKPKLGLSHQEHSKVAYDAWKGGLDIVKDDENLSDMSFNRFEKRLDLTLNERRKAEEETGERKFYMPNITSKISTMKKRADMVIEQGGEYVMIDIITCGWSALQEMRDYLEGKNIAIHAHRAGHAAFTREKEHGISMLTLAKIARLIGVDQLHIGTAGLGKMEGGETDVLNIEEEIENPRILAHKYVLDQGWHEKKRTLAVASGGLHPGLVGDLINSMGTDIVIQAGGGVHGHPKGTLGGAKAMRQAADAYMEGEPLEEVDDSKKELRQAIEKWG